MAAAATVDYLLRQRRTSPDLEEYVEEANQQRRQFRDQGIEAEKMLQAAKVAAMNVVGVMPANDDDEDNTTFSLEQYREEVAAASSQQLLLIPSLDDVPID